MPCRCGKLTIPTPKVPPAKVPPAKTPHIRLHATKKATPVKKAAPVKKSAASRRATRIATRKANARKNPYAGGCKCT